MKITKFGHSCLLIDTSTGLGAGEGGVRSEKLRLGARILIDPGIFSTSQNSVKNIDLILITHEHQDHFSLDSLKIVLKNNPGAKTVTNKSVGVLLQKENISYSVLKNGEVISEKGVLIEGVGEEHASIYSAIPQIENIGYLIADRFFYPGDNLTIPNKKVEILALPVAAPWVKLQEVIDYAIKINPKVCFPVHDGILSYVVPFHRIPAQILEPKEIKFNILEIDREYQF